MRKLTHVFWLCLFVCLWIGNVARAQISAVSSPGAVCAGSNVTVNLTGAFNPGCTVNFFLVQNNTAGPGVQIAGPLPARSSPAYTLTIPASATPGNYVIYVTSNCGGGNVAPAFPLVYPTLAGSNYTASFPIQAPYVPSMVGWLGENSLLDVPYGALSTTGTIYGCQGSGTISIVGLFAGDAAPGDSYRWLRNGSPITGSVATGMVGVTGFLDAAGTATLIINDPKLAQAGTYSIELNPTGGACPARLGAITLNINTVPVIVGTFSASSNRICAGATSTINSLSITGGSNSYCYRWGSTSGTDVDAYSSAAPMPFDPETVANGGDCNELPTASNPTFTVGGPNLAAGTYQYNLVVIDKTYGCRAQQTNDIVVEVTPSPGVLTATIPVTTPTFLCTGSVVPITLTTNLTVDNGPASFHPDIKFNWSGPAGFSSQAEDPSFNYTNATAQNGVYMVTATVAGSTCSASTSVSISGRQTPNPVISGLSQICDGGAVTLTVAPGTDVPTSPGVLSYTFTPVNAGVSGPVVVGPQASNTLTTPSLVLTANAAGTATYSVTVAYTNNPACSTTSGSHVINVTPTPLTLLAGPRGYFTNGPVAVCEGSTIDIEVGSNPALAAFSAGTTFSWAGPAGFASNLKNPTVTTNAALSHAGTYSVTVMRITGTATCSASTTMLVSVAPRPTASIATPGIVCAGAPVTLNATGGSASTPGATVTYEWSLVQDAASIAPFNPYLPIGSVPPVSVFAGPGGLSAFNDGNFGGLVGVFNPVYIATGTKTNTLNITGIPSMNALGLFSAGVTSNNWGFRVRATITTNGLACRSNSNLVNLVVAETPKATASNNTPVCEGSTVSLTAGNGNVLTNAQTAWSWAGGSVGFTSSLRTPSITNAPVAASGVYTVSVSNTQYASCSATATTRVEVVPQPVAVVTPDPVVVCAGEPITITASGAVAGSTYQWAQVADHGGNQNVWASQNPINTINNGDNWWAAGAKVSGTTTNTFGINPALLDNTNLDVEYSVARVRIKTQSADGSLTCASNAYVRIAVVNAPATPVVQGRTFDGNGAVVTTYNGATQYLCIDGGSNGNASELELRDNATHPAGAAVKYMWAGPAGFTSTEATPNIVITSTGQAGVYSVTVSTTVNEGLVSHTCQTTGTISVVVSVTPTPTIQNLTPAICEGSGVGLQVQGGIPAGSTYAWYVIDNGTPFFASPTPVTGGPNLQPSLAIGAYPAVSPGFVPFSITSNQDLLVITNADAGIGTGPNQLQGFGTGNYGFRVVVNNNGCKATAVTNVAVTANPEPRAEAGTGVGPIAATNNVSGTAKKACTTGGIAANKTWIALRDEHNYVNDIGAANITWLWSGPNGFSSTVRNPAPFEVTTTAQGGVYTVSAVNTANNVCVGTSTVSVAVVLSPKDVVLSSISSKCFDGTGITISSTDGGVPTPTYQWYGELTAPDGTPLGGTPLAGATNSTVVSNPGTSAAPDHTYYYGVRVTNDVCSADAGPRAVTIYSLPTINTNALLLASKAIGPKVPFTAITNNQTGVTQLYACEGEALFLDATATNYETFTWTGPNGLTNSAVGVNGPAWPVTASLTSAFTGTYTLTLTKVNGCTDTKTFVLNVMKKPTLAPIAADPKKVCAGGSIAISAGGGNLDSPVYAWTSGGVVTTFTSASANPTFTPPAATPTGLATLSVTVTNSPSVAGLNQYFNECVANGSVTVSVNSTVTVATAAITSSGEIVLTSGKYYVCSGTAVNLTGSLGGSQMTSYSWSSTAPNGNGTSASSASVGTYTITATTNHSGVYTLTIANGTVGSGACTASKTVELVVAPAPTVAPVADPAMVCAGTSILLTSGQTNGNKYSWNGGASSRSDGSIFTSTSSDPTLATSNLNATTGRSYSVTVSNTLGGLTSCSVSSTVKVVINESPSIANIEVVGGGATKYTSPLGAITWYICEGRQLQLNVVSANANIPGAPQYLWSGPTLASTQQSPLVAVNASAINTGVYTVVVSNDGTSCKTTGTISVVVVEKPVVGVNYNPEVCAGTTIQLQANVDEYTSVVWRDNNNAFLSNTLNPSVPNATNAANGGIYSFTAFNEVFAINGAEIHQCQTSATLSVVVRPNPSPLSAAVQTVAPGAVSSSSPFVRCEGTALNLQIAVDNTVAPFNNYTWAWSGPGLNAGGFSQSLTPASLSQTGEYSVVVTNQFGCTASNTFSIIVKERPVLSVSASPSLLCAGGTVQLNVNSSMPGTSFAWDGPNGFTANTATPSITSATPAATGTYTVSATNSGCTASGSVAVEVLGRPAIPVVQLNNSNNFGPVFTRCEGTAMTLNIENQANGLTYGWTGPGGFSQTGTSLVLTPTMVVQSGQYTVEARNEAGCSRSTTISINIKPLPVPTYTLVGNTLCLSATGGNGVFNWTGPTQTITASRSVNDFAGPTPPALAVPGGAEYILARAAAGIPAYWANATATYTYVGPVPGVGVWTAVYTWTGSAVTSTLNHPCFSPVPASYNGSWTVTSGGCSTEFLVSAPTPAPSVVASANPGTVLAGSNVALSATVTNGPATSYAWAGPCGFSSASATPTVNNIGAGCGGNYSVTVTTAGGTASAVVNVQVTVPAPPPGVADLWLIKDSKYRTMRSGTKTYITMIVKNNGPNAASGVVVTDVLPAGMSYTTPSNLSDSVIDDGLEHGSFSVSGNTITGNIGSLAVGESKEIKFYAMVTGSVGVTLLNTGSITSSANPDPNSGNNTDDVSILIVPGSSSRVAAGESTDGAIVVKSYPNPATDKVTIELTLDEPSKAELRMTDFSGRTVGEWKLDEEKTHHTAEISMKEFKAGLYLLNAEAGNKRAVKKIVKAEN